MGFRNRKSQSAFCFLPAYFILVQGRSWLADVICGLADFTTFCNEISRRIDQDVPHMKLSWLIINISSRTQNGSYPGSKSNSLKVIDTAPESLYKFQNSKTNISYVLKPAGVVNS